MPEIIEAKYRDQHMIASEINILTTQAKKMALQYAIEIGDRLQEAKSMLQHGEWGNWLEAEVSYSQSTADNFMRIATEYGNQQASLFGTSNSESFEKLEYSKLVALLAVPTEQRETFAEQVGAEDLSVSQLKEEIRKLKEGQAKADRSKEIEALEQKATEEELKRKEAIDRIMELEVQLKEAEESQPTEVPTETLELLQKEAEKAARAELEAKLIKEKDKAKKAAKKAATAELEAKSAAEKLKAEQQAAVERERLQKEREEARRKGDKDQIEKLQKQLDMASDEAAIKFKVLFANFQVTYQNLTETAEQVKDAQMQSKLQGAIAKLCRAWAEE